MSRPFLAHQESQYRYPASPRPTRYNRRVDERQWQNNQSRYSSENCRYMYDYENNTSPIDTSSSLSSPIVDTTADTYVKCGENERRQYRSPATRTQHFHRFDCSPSVTGRNVEFEYGKSRPHEVYQYSTADTTSYKTRRQSLRKTLAILASETTMRHSLLMQVTFLISDKVTTVARHLRQDCKHNRSDRGNTGTM
jgi:hypothetical protein